MRYLSVLTVAVALAACAGPQVANKKSAAKAPLDNKTFTAVVTKDGKAEVDEFVFQNGRFISATAELKGFKPATYTTIKDGDFMRFEAVATSPESGTMRWTGTVRGKEIEGMAVLDQAWWRPNQKYPFTGKLKGQASQQAPNF